MKVHWTDTAIEHLQAIYHYIAKSSPDYALRVVDRLTRRSRQIAEFPLSGRVVPEIDLPQIRQVIEGPFRIIYHLQPDQIDIVAVIHGARESPWKGES